MADTSNLSRFLGDVADAIRTKKGTTEPIAAADFDVEISNLETGGNKYPVKASFRDEYVELDETIANAKIENFGLEGQSFQNGTPKSNSFVAIDHVTGNIDIRRRGENIFDNTFLENGGLILNDSGYYQGVGTGFHPVYGVNTEGIPVQFKEATRYTLTFTGKLLVDAPDNERTLFFRFYYTDGAYSDCSLYGSTLKEFTFNSATEKTIQKVCMSYGYQHEFIIKDVKLTESEAIRFPLGNQELAKTEYLADDGIHSNHEMTIFDGTENWIYNRASDGFTIFYVDITNLGNVNYCTHFLPYRSVSSPETSEYFLTWSFKDTNNFEIRIKNEMLADVSTNEAAVESLKTYLAEQYTNGTPLQIERIIDETIIAYTEEQRLAWDKLKNITTYNNMTTIGSINTVKPILSGEVTIRATIEYDCYDNSLTLAKEILLGEESGYDFIGGE